MDRRSEFGRRLRELRIRQGYSQERFAEKAGLHRTYVGGVERGERNVSLENIWRIADALGVNPATLFLDEFIREQTRSEKPQRTDKRRLSRSGTWTRR